MSLQPMLLMTLENVLYFKMQSALLPCACSSAAVMWPYPWHLCAALMEVGGCRT